MPEHSNKRMLLREVPDGMLRVDHFAVDEVARPTAGADEVVCRTILLSVDAANRAWMQGRTYREAVVGGGVMAGYGLAEVVESRAATVPVGSVVACDTGWQEYAVLPADEVRTVEARAPLPLHLSVLGHTGLTAWFGLIEVGRVTAGDTVLVSAAAGATGNVVGQLARHRGARVVGITGDDDKAAMLVDELGFDAVVNHRGDVGPALRRACPDGVDLYFDNVGGPILEHALRAMNVHGRIVCCGVVSQYDTASPAPGPRGVPGLLVTKRIRMEGFLLSDFVDRWDAAETELATLVDAGELIVLQEVLHGLDEAPGALVGLLRGDNRGKRMVRVGPDPAGIA